MEANRGVSKKKAVNNDDSGYEDVFDADDDYEMGDFLDEGSLEGLESPHYSFASTPNLSPLHSTMPNSNSVPGVNALLSHSGVEYSQGQLPTPQKTPAPNRFTPTTLLPSFQKLRDFGKRALFSNQSSTLHRNSTSRRPNTIIETIQRERLADTDIATVPVTAYRGRPRAFSDVKRVKLRRGERLVTVSDDEE
jgi:hypothetical protein